MGPHQICLEFDDPTRDRFGQIDQLFDANNHVVTRRVDFARYLTGTISPSPGFATDDADLLVQAVTRAVDEAEWDPVEGRISHSKISYGTHPLDAAAAWWLSEQSSFRTPADADQMSGKATRAEPIGGDVRRLTYGHLSDIGLFDIDPDADGRSVSERHDRRIKLRGHLMPWNVPARR
jgi:hypothetical protein